MPNLPCSYGCRLIVGELTVGSLAAHYVEIHRVPATVALQEARREVGAPSQGSPGDRAPESTTGYEGQWCPHGNVYRSVKKGER